MGFSWRAPFTAAYKIVCPLKNISTSTLLHKLVDNLQASLQCTTISSEQKRHHLRPLKASSTLSRDPPFADSSALDVFRGDIRFCRLLNTFSSTWGDKNLSRDLTLEAILIPTAFLVPNVHCSVIIRETAVRLSQFRTLKRMLKCEKKWKIYGLKLSVVTLFYRVFLFPQKLVRIWTKYRFPKQTSWTSPRYK